MIRKFESKDKASVLQILQSNIPKYFAPEELEDFELYLEKEMEDYFVMEISRKIVGAGGINSFPKEKEARISWDMVHPSCHGQGIGRELTLHRIEHVQEKRSFEKLVVRTSQFVYPFYQKMGFKLEYSKKDFWAEGYDMYYLSHKLQY